MDFNFWDDRTMELYSEEGIHPCNGCCDFKDGECISKGGCTTSKEDSTN